MDNDKLFPTQESKDQAVLAFNSLKNHLGWKIYQQILDANIEVLTKTLTESDFEDLAEQKKLKVQRQAYIDARDTVEKMIQVFTSKPVQQDVEADPYEQRKPEQVNG